MPSEAAEPLRPSLIDRLGAPAGSGNRAALEGISIAELKSSVARDLEWLLNTRVWSAWQLDPNSLAQRSIMAYGIPDLSVYSWDSSDDAREIKSLIEEAIRTFEPRLLPNSVRIEVVASENVADFRLRIRIEALLRVEPVSEPVVFDTGLDFEGGGLRVEHFE